MLSTIPVHQLTHTWQQHLLAECEQPYVQKLDHFLDSEYQQKAIYPPKSQIFQALELTPFEQVKVVIIGQDPYHGEGQAHGLSFSVQQGIALPPSLKNIYKELQQDVGFTHPNHGCLTAWAKQGVLMLNAVLTVESGKAGSHQKKGWERFTDCIISQLNQHRDNLVFILWGAYAQKKGEKIDNTRHLVISSAHPSPLSVRHGFYGSRPFSKANDYLISKGILPIDWQL